MLVQAAGDAAAHLFGPRPRSAPTCSRSATARAKESTSLHHVALWDIMSRNALFFTGNGTNDDHSGDGLDRHDE